MDVKIIALNDFHGNLMPPPEKLKIKDPQNLSQEITVTAGGIEHLTTLVEQLRAKNPNNIIVAAGDLVGASPLLSSIFSDEPTIEALSLMGLEASAVGNHEFDRGRNELLRKQYGGCTIGNAKKICQGDHVFTGAKYTYLAASTMVNSTGKALFPAYYIKKFEGIPIAFIGLTLKGTPLRVTPTGVAGLTFKDEADTVNALLPELKRQGVAAFVVLIHEGLTQKDNSNINACDNISGDLLPILQKLDRSIGLVISGHTHEAYNCTIDGRLVTSANRYGRMVTDIDVKLDRTTKQMVQARANNVVARIDTYAKNPAQTNLLEPYTKIATKLAARPVGSITADIVRDANDAGQMLMGDVIADGMLLATQASQLGGAQIALMNPGGIRTGLIFQGTGQVTYGDIFAVHPFDNALVTITLTGDQIKRVLEQQWGDSGPPRFLQISEGFSYSWDNNATTGARILPASMKLNGVTLDPMQKYRVTVNEFLASGGDRFSVFTQGTDQITGIPDVDALEAYMQSHDPLSPHPLARITRIN